MDYYNILGIDKSASQEEIKQAYRKLAMQYHPDRANGDKDRFQQIQTAYNVLSDPQKRAEYDNPQQNNFRFEFNTGGQDFFDQIFQQFHGHPGFGFTFNQQRPKRNRDLRIFIEMDLVETLNDQEKTISVKTSTGERIPIKINVPRGVQPGTTLRVSGQGDNAQTNLPRGDLYVNINVRIPENWNIMDNNLVTQLNINSFEAMLGVEKEITTIENKQLMVKVPPGTQPNSRLAIRGQGVYTLGNNQRGDIILLVNILTPTNLTVEQIALIEKAKSIQ